MSEDVGPDPVADSPERWPVVESHDLHRDDWVVALRADSVLRPGTGDDGGDAEPFRRLVLEHPGAAVILALDEQQRVCCLRQYRHAPGRRFLELPAGLCDQEGETPLEVARRELVEEAALEAGEWLPLATTYSSPGISDELVHLFLARDLRPADRGGFVAEHEEADMELLWVPFADLHRAVLDGRVADSPVVIAVLMAVARGVVALPPRGAGPAE